MSDDFSYNQFKAMVPVSKHTLDDALETQADVMERISSRAVHWGSRVSTSKEELAKVEARVASKLRDEAKDAGDKVTLDVIATATRRDPDRVRAWERHHEFNAEYERWKGLLDAWRQRGFSIKSLCDLYAAQYFSVSSVTSTRKTSLSGADSSPGREALRGASIARGVTPRTVTRRTVI